jgi:hypothetical protein
MKAKKYIPDGYNTGKLIETNETITIKPRRWVDDRWGVSNPMKYDKPIAYENKNVYFFYHLGGKEKGIHVSLTFWQNQKFNWIQNKHWLQKEENIRYIINILFLIGGLIIGVLNYNK